MEPITKESYVSWLMNPVTEAMRHEMGLLKRELEESLGLGQTLNMENADETLGLTAGIVGRISGINDFLNFGDRFNQEQEEGEREGE